MCFSQRNTYRESRGLGHIAPTLANAILVWNSGSTSYVGNIEIKIVFTCNIRPLAFGLLKSSVQLLLLYEGLRLT